MIERDLQRELGELFNKYQDYPMLAKEIADLLDFARSHDWASIMLKTD